MSPSTIVLLGTDELRSSLFSKFVGSAFNVECNSPQDSGFLKLNQKQLLTELSQYASAGHCSAVILDFYNKRHHSSAKIDWLAIINTLITEQKFDWVMLPIEKLKSNSKSQRDAPTTHGCFKLDWQ